MVDNLLAVAEALLAELAASKEPVSAARLCKRLKIRMSTLLRSVAFLSDHEIGGQPGPGLVYMTQDGERSLLALTEKGRAECDGAGIKYLGNDDAENNATRH
jgi:hypothetical protein